MSPTPPQRMLLAGGTGLIGRELMHQLSGKAAPLTLLTRRPLPAGYAPPGAQVIEVPSLTQPGAVPPLDAACIALGTTMAQAGSE